MLSQAIRPVTVPVCITSDISAPILRRCYFNRINTLFPLRRCECCCGACTRAQHSPCWLQIRAAHRTQASCWPHRHRRRRSLTVPYPSCPNSHRLDSLRGMQSRVHNVTTRHGVVTVFLHIIVQASATAYDTGMPLWQLSPCQKHFLTCIVLVYADQPMLSDTTNGFSLCRSSNACKHDACIFSAVCAFVLLSSLSIPSSIS